LKEHAEQIRQLAAEPCVGLVNSLAALKAGIVRGLLVPDFDGAGQSSERARLLAGFP
jgi:hypothetical protein